MQPTVTIATQQEELSLRTRHRAEMNCQIVHDSIHTRPGWTKTYLLQLAGKTISFGSIAISGPWHQKPTFFEFYVAPEYRCHAFRLFEVFLAASEPEFFEIQSNDTIAAVMAITFGDQIGTEKIVFQDHSTTTLPAGAATLRSVTPESKIVSAIQERAGGGEWVLELNGQTVASGGILFHYNPPYGDIYMDVKEPFRRRGFGSFLVQELKRICYELGGIPAARCSPDNVASRRTLQAAGFAPYAHILIGRLKSSAAWKESPVEV